MKRAVAQAKPHQRPIPGLPTRVSLAPLDDLTQFAEEEPYGASFHHYEPASGRFELSPLELDQLRRELHAFASRLSARDEFSSALSVASRQLGDRVPTVALLLRADESGGAYVFEYRPHEAEFVAVACADPPETYLAVFECWATDLLAAFCTELSARTFGTTCSHLWNALPRDFAFEPIREIFEYAAARLEPTNPRLG